MRLPTPNDPATEDVWGDELNDLLAEVVGPASFEPASPNAKDDEFDGTSTVTWTTTPTAPTTMNITDRPGALRIVGNGTGAAYVGELQPVPASYPYTITAKVLTSSIRGGNCRGGGIILTNGVVGGSSVCYFGHVLSTFVSTWAVKGTLAGSWGGGGSAWGNGQRTNTHFKVVVLDSTTIDCFVSWDGTSWFKVETAFVTGFTTPTHMGLAVTDESNGTGGCDAYFDFFRVT